MISIQLLSGAIAQLRQAGERIEAGDKCYLGTKEFDQDVYAHQVGADALFVGLAMEDAEPDQLVRTLVWGPYLKDDELKVLT